MISQDEARARVQRGAAHLDVVRPGWFNRIDVGTLTLSDPCGCIVGQLCGGYWLGLELLGIKHGDSYSLGVGIKRGADFMDEADVDAAWVPIQSAWVEAIADRRLSTTPNGTPDGDAVPVRPTVEMHVCSRT